MVRLALLMLIAPRSLPAQTNAQVVLDDFEGPVTWSPYPADGVEMRLTSAEGRDGSGLRFDFHFLKGGGYAVARRSLDLELPENYALTFWLRGDAPVNHLELKLLDPTGENVWWFVRRDLAFPREWERFRTKKRQVSFAWGPAGGGEIRRLGAVEIVVTAGTGGQGTIWIDDFSLEPLPPPQAVPPEPIATASSSRPGSLPDAVLDGNPETAWSPQLGDAAPWLELDFQDLREFGGLVLDWAPEKHGSDYVIEVSDDRAAWREIRRVVHGNGGRDPLYLPESEARYLRIRGALVELRGIEIQPLEWSATREVFFRSLAREERRGLYPRGILGEPSPWTVVGADNDAREVLFNQDGALETGMQSFSVEPFLRLGDQLITWSDVERELTLEQGCLPVPSVRWTVDGLSLRASAFATGNPGASSIVGRYHLYNQREAAVECTLYLALRPFQVNPPSQWLNRRGGAARLRELSVDGRAVVADGRRAVLCLTEPETFAAATFDQGDIVAEYLALGQIPRDQEADDPFEAASGVLVYPFHLPPGAEKEVAIVIPLYEHSPEPPSGRDAALWVQGAFEETRRSWEDTVENVELSLPEVARDFHLTLKSQIGYILVNRAGPAIQPGTRAYARSWIRDGSLTSSALLRFGLNEPVREFLEWFAPYQYANGKIPCCVDHRGSDPVPEHDSSGQFLFLLAEYYRYTGDRSTIERHWPALEGAVAYLDSLRRERRTPEYEQGDRRIFYGLLPPSISHEGYSAKPMHSYWDDLFAVRGFRDAVFLAEALGRLEDAACFRSIRDEFEADFAASVRAVLEHHGIDYVPGCADLGDFDATSTTIALSPVGAVDLLPPAALERTFEKYWEFFVDRRAGAPWEAFTPYELRNVGAFVHLGGRDRAHELVDWFLSHRMPPAWRQWSEVVWSDTTEARFLGDLPHTWVGSDFVRSALDMLTYVREDGEALVVAAGVPASWLEDPAGVGVKALPTPFGPITWSLRKEPGALVARIGGALRVPSGGIELRPPIEAGMIGGAPGQEVPKEGASLDGDLRKGEKGERIHPAVTVNGQPAIAKADGSIVVREVPAEVVVRF